MTDGERETLVNWRKNCGSLAAIFKQIAPGYKMCNRCVCVCVCVGRAGENALVPNALRKGEDVIIVFALAEGLGINSF